MKKVKKSKLSLNAETLRQLDARQLQQVVGGFTQICTNTCLGTACQCAPTHGPNCDSVGWTNCICSGNCTTG